MNVVLTCFVCQAQLHTDRPSRLLRHARQVHANIEVNFTCHEPGCWNKGLGTVPACMAVEHYCGHLSTRDSMRGDDDDDDDDMDQAGKEARLQAEEENNPVGDLLDDWLVDEQAQKTDSKHNFSLPPVKLTKDQEIKFDFLTFAVKHALTQQAHTDLFNTKLFKGLIEGFPTPTALKRQAWDYLDSVGLAVADLSGGRFKEPVPFFSFLQSLRAWMLHPLLSGVIVDVSDRCTLPHAHSLYFDSQPPVHDPVPESFTFSTMADGNEWLEPFRRTSQLWYPAFLAALANQERVVFIHGLLFGDGLPLWKLRQQSFEVVTTTLGEFDEGLRSSFNSPAIQVNAMASKEMQKTFFKGYDGLLAIFKADFDALSKGVRFWCEALQQTVTVFGVFHGFEGDLPARCQAGGFKKPSGNTHSDCNCCEGTKGKAKELVESGNLPPLRDPESLLPLVERIMASKGAVREALMYQHGITRKSALWAFPGAQLSKQLLGELMHCEAEGELPKHFSHLINKFSVADPLFFTKLDARTRTYFGRYGVAFPSIATKEKWFWHTNAADRFRFSLHSIFLLTPFVKESLTVDFALWKVHVRFVQLLAQHTITKKDVDIVEALPFAIQRGLLNLYGSDVLTPNSHWTFHAHFFIRMFSVMRLYWTFPQESLLHKMKNITKKMTNHKATSYSCLRLFVLDRQLNLLFKPLEHIPKRNDLLQGRQVAIGSLSPALSSHGLTVTPHHQMLTGCKLLKDYQLYGVDTVARTPTGLKLIEDLIVVDQRLFCLVRNLIPAGKRHHLQVFEKSTDVFLEPESFLHRCWGAWEEGLFVLNFEEK